MPLPPLDWPSSSVLVTGGTGSFGQSFISTLLSRYHPRRLAVLSRDELKQSEMKKIFPESQVRYLLGDVRDPSRLHRAFTGVDIVVHAAALKQVPACEQDPFEAVQTNIMGARNVIDAAIDCGVTRVFALSSDKAVAPANLYGATKLVAEKLFVQGNAYAGARPTRFSCARYGNVLGSRGSVVPLFLEQAKSGTVTVTDRRMTRFWLTLSQGVDFVCACLERMEGGEVFVPKLPSSPVMALARAVAPDAQLSYTGIRPGEKLHESLISEDESPNAYEFADHYVIKPAYHSWRTDALPGGKPVFDRFSYRSDTNPRQIGSEGLKGLVDGHKDSTGHPVREA